LRDIHPSIARLLTRPEAERRIGPFALVEQLGRGGFAPVWLAREMYGAETLRTAAVKLFALEAAADDDAARARIIEEARALCRVEHPNVVRLYALPVDEATGVMGLAMEHAAGSSLAARLASQGRLSAIDALDIGVALASALSAVHRVGLVHRDVKPANVVETAGTYKLIDFGIASTGVAGDPSQQGAPAADQDRTGRIAALQSGTIGYLDPVIVATGAPASPASDLYALGATLFECLTGRVPAGASIQGGEGLDPRLIDGRARPPRVAALARDVPPPLADLVDALVAPDRRVRPASAELVATLLEQIRRSLAARAGVLASRQTRRGARLLLAAVVGAGLSAFGSAVTYVWVSRAEEATPWIALTQEPQVRRESEEQQRRLHAARERIEELTGVIAIAQRREAEDAQPGEAQAAPQPQAAPSPPVQRRAVSRGTQPAGPGLDAGGRDRAHERADSGQERGAVMRGSAALPTMNAPAALPVEPAMEW
jgi:Protein kinase domain